jgi:hypothetical protein
MKSKLSQLEQEGISPTRDHVRTQLDNIKNLTLGKREMWGEGGGCSIAISSRWKGKFSAVVFTYCTNFSMN